MIDAVTWLTNNSLLIPVLGLTLANTVNIAKLCQWKIDHVDKK